MGSGICGAILLDFEIETSRKNDFTKNSARKFWDNYELLPQKEKSNYEQYVIKNDVLVPNYANFLVEFYNLIYGKFEYIRHSLIDKAQIEEYTKRLLSCKNREEFDELFERDNRNAAVPFICSMLSVSCLSCYNNTPFVFYSGSYKAFLEEYSTLVHMERMLVKAMDNPLKHAVKFGIYG